VPSPCGGVWIGVGHMYPAGAGARNPFGRDFAANDHVSILSLRIRTRLLMFSLS